MANNFAADYIDVATRIREFREVYPNGSLRPANPDKPYWIESIEGVGLRLVYVAAAYRYPEDPAPGIGMAWEPLPGRTPYTRDSELMVAETSAWGRAIVAALAGDTRKSVASADEVRARQTDSKDEAMLPPSLPSETLEAIVQTFVDADTPDALNAAYEAGKDITAKHLLSATQISRLRTALTQAKKRLTSEGTDTSDERNRTAPSGADDAA